MKSTELKNEMVNLLTKLISIDVSQTQGVNVANLQIGKEQDDNGWTYHISANIKVTKIEKPSQ